VCYKKLRGTSKPKFFDESSVATHTIQGKEGEKACPRCNGLVSKELVNFKGNVARDVGALIYLVG
jgi:hypothetical protein